MAGFDARDIGARTDGSDPRQSVKGPKGSTPVRASKESANNRFPDAGANDERCRLSQAPRPTVSANFDPGAANGRFGRLASWLRVADPCWRSLRPGSSVATERP